MPTLAPAAAPVLLPPLLLCTPGCPPQGCGKRGAKPPCCLQVNNFLGVLGIDRNVGDAPYRLHIGFAATYFVTMRDVFLAKLKAALAKHPGSDVYMSGHSRGGAMATLATFDLAAETGAQVGVGTAGKCRLGARPRT